LATITPSDVRRIMMKNAAAVLCGEITPKQADATIRACRGVTRELNRRADLAATLARATSGPKPKGK
jgi:hypothetical protein